MKYIIITSIILLVLIIWIFYIFRRKWAIKKVNLDSDIEKLSYINAILEPFGFEFDLKQQIVISKNDSWQRDIGFHDLYDLKAPFLNMVIDCEPIYFDYDNKHYRLEFWKGQYGITTGAEIGIYVREFDSDLKENYYRCANDDECLKMNFILFNKCFLFSRSALTWWLTAFDVGKFSKPKDLKLKACIAFEDTKIQIAFVKGLLNAGYTKNNFEVYLNYICFDYCSPHNHKLNSKYKIVKFFAQIMNKINCKIYNHFTRYFNRTIDKLAYLKYLAPCFYKLIINLSIPRKKQKKYYKKNKKNSK